MSPRIAAAAWSTPDPAVAGQDSNAVDASVEGDVSAE
jgi:hypothetical protein